LAAKDSKDYNITHLALTKAEWQFLKSLCKVFSFYKPVTVKLSTQSYLTLYNVLLQYIILKNQLIAAVRQNRGVKPYSLLANAI
jgi:hypothetical protein